MNEEYLKEKEILIEYYTNILRDFINDISVLISNDINEVLGLEYKILKSEYEEIDKLLEEKNKEYLNSKEYIQLKEEVSYLQSYLYLKKELNSFSSDEELKESQQYKDYFMRLKEISDLNLKFNNRLKKYRDRKQLIGEEVKILFINKRDELLEIKRKYVVKLGNTIVQIVDEYNQKLFKLNEKYGIDIQEKEFPFNEKEFKIRISSKLESNAFKEIEKNEEEEIDTTIDEDIDNPVKYKSIDDSIN